MRNESQGGSRSGIRRCLEDKEVALLPKVEGGNRLRRRAEGVWRLFSLLWCLLGWGWHWSQQARRVPQGVLVSARRNCPWGEMSLLKATEYGFGRLSWRAWAYVLVPGHGGPWRVGWCWAPGSHSRKEALGVHNVYHLPALMIPWDLQVQILSPSQEPREVGKCSDPYFTELAQLRVTVY